MRPEAISETVEKRGHSLWCVAEPRPEIVHLQQEDDFGPFGALSPHFPQDRKYRSLGSMKLPPISCGYCSQLNTRILGFVQFV